MIVIDPGHGGDNLGTEEGYRLEKEMTMVTAMALVEELNKIHWNINKHSYSAEEVRLILKYLCQP